MNENSKIKKSDLRTFGLIWAGIFLVIGIYPLLDNENLRIWSVVISLLFIAVSFIKPVIMTTFYKKWVLFGAVIGGIVSKVIMFILYFGLFTPVSLVLKIMGKDLLNKKVDKSVNSYWVERETQPQSMKNQF